MTEDWQHLGPSLSTQSGGTPLSNSPPGESTRKCSLDTQKNPLLAAVSSSFAPDSAKRIGQNQWPFLRRNLRRTENAAKHWSDCWTPSSNTDYRRNFLHVEISCARIANRFTRILVGRLSPATILGEVSVTLAVVDASGRQTSFVSQVKELVINSILPTGPVNRSTLQIRSRNSLGGLAEAANFSFDLSAILTFLRRFPKGLVLAVDIFLRAGNRAISGVHASNKRVAHLQGERCIIDAGKSRTSSEIQIASHRVDLNYVGIPGPSSELLSLVARNIESQVEARGLAVSATADVLLGCGEEGTLETVRNKQKQHRNSGVGTLLLDVRGGLRWPEEDLYEGLYAKRTVDMGTTGKLCVHVIVTYRSPALPKWTGITRHDFVCPWCHCNCFRLRSLIVHLQRDHKHTKLNLYGNAGLHYYADSVCGEMPFQMVVSVIKVEPSFLEYAAKSVQASRVKTPAGECADDTKVLASGSVEDHGAKKTLRPGSVDTNCVLATCIQCGRRFENSEGLEVEVCGDWCNMLRRSENFEKTHATMHSRRSLRSFSCKGMEQSARFRAATKGMQLHHIITFERFHDAHFDDRDLDSEDEVDHTWRTKLEEERITRLPVSRKHKVLWTMWNRFGSVNGFPGSYGDQYLRHGVERFAMECGTEVARLGLRVPFVAFLRALHVHGFIDSCAVVSALRCLDGRKKWRACRESRQPKEQVDIL